MRFNSTGALQTHSSSRGVYPAVKGATSAGIAANGPSAGEAPGASSRKGCG